MSNKHKTTKKTEYRRFVRYELGDRTISGRVVWISADGVLRFCRDDGVFVNVITARRLLSSDEKPNRSCGRFRKHLFRRIDLRIVDRIDDGRGDELFVAEFCEDVG